MVGAHRVAPAAKLRYLEGVSPLVPSRKLNLCFTPVSCRLT